MHLSRTTQLALFRKYATRGFYAAQAHDGLRMRSILNLAERRAFGSEGIEVYGDSTWWLDRPEKVFQAECETADRAFYWATILAQDAGDLCKMRVKQSPT